jgi:hypothetical protein
MNQIVIIGGGDSIREGIDKGLWEFLSTKWTLACNSAYKFITPSVLTFVDHRQFYQLFFEDIKNLPLMIGKSNPAIQKRDNLLLLPHSRQFDPTLQLGVYVGFLCGLFSLTLAQYFLPTEGEIYLLGYDFCSNGKVGDKDRTHFYQENPDIQHTGIGRAGYYRRPGKTKLFDPYLTLTNVKIFNVSKISTIPQFPKISYDEFFDRLQNDYNQNELRDYMDKKVRPLSV